MLSELFYSVEDVWVIWLVTISVLATMAYRAVRCQRWSSLRQFTRDENGASYALPYLMTFPFYMFAVCFVIQATMILLVKVGVMYSAHTAARAAVVWRSADPTSDSQGRELAEKKARAAAVLAIAPFASGLDGHQQMFQYDPRARMRAIQARPQSYFYDKLYRKLARHSEAKDCLADSAFVRRKFVFASAMVKDVVLSRPRNEFNQPLSASVTYRMPVHIPGAGRVMGTLHWTRKFFFRDIRATATLPLETPLSASKRLGIGYDSSRL